MSASLGIVGDILGDLGDGLGASTGIAGWTNTDISFDYAIGGVPFMVRPSDDVPYQRQTAQFRKDQIDSESTVGEQSLDGFWRRSQFALNGGAGVKYLDAFTHIGSFTSDTSTRAFELEGVDPFTTVGELTLGPSFSSNLHVNHSAAQTGYDGTTSPVAWFIDADDSGKLHKWTGAANTAAAGTATATAFTVDPNPSGRAYYANGTTIKTSNAGATVATLSAGTWQGLWWAKQRLIGLDNLGNWYQIPPLGSTSITQGSGGAGFFWAGNGRTDGWNVSDAPSAIFMSYGRTVYSVTLDNTGAVPTLVGGIVAAEVPIGETIVSMTYYLGFLVLVTNLGPRVAQTDSSGNVQYGPRLFDLVASNCRGLAASGTRVWFTGKRDTDDHPMVFTIDLSQPTTSGAYAYATEADANLQDVTSSGVIVFGSSIAPWDGVDLFTAGTAAARTGFVTTGFIRFGTMEPKAFYSVRIKLDGAGGSVDVILVRRGGGETTLTNVAAEDGTDRDVKINLPGPEEFIALKFLMHADSVTGDSPILLGYQLTALPAPKRNRIIQVPLMVFDGERSPHGTLFSTSAYDAWSALEEMEEAAGVVWVQDFRTGEAFEAFIEQTQFLNTSPPNRGVGNFAGTGLVTLRKVS